MRVSDEERKRLARNAANNLRRRVVHKRQRCAACREWFVPKRSDAKACSNRCRQALFRERSDG
jgi:hypothetical protein